MARIKTIYAEAWSENWGAVPLTEDEFDRIVGEFRMIYDRDLFFIAEYDGEPAGMSLVLPDMNQALSKAGGRLLPLGLAEDPLAPAEDRRLAHARPGGPAGAPPARHRGRLLLPHLRRRQDEAELPEGRDVLDPREQYRGQRRAEKLGARRSKTYRIYETAAWVERLACGCW